MIINIFRREKVLLVLRLSLFVAYSFLLLGAKNFDFKTNRDVLSTSLEYDLETSKNSLKILNTSVEKSSIAIITWNIQNLGQSKSDEEIDFIVNVLRDYDIVAIQEVVAKHPAGAQKVAQIADELNRKGAKWDYRISNPTNSPSAYISERYAFLWKTSKLDIQGRAYLDAELAPVVNREPYISKFKSKKEGNTFHVVNFHSRKHDDHPELEIIHFKNYQDRLDTDRLIIAGDFNLNEGHPVWDSLYQQGFKSALKNQKTTLKRKCDRGDYLSHAIDNIYFSKGLNQVNSGVVDFIQNCENLSAARLISDHLPVFSKFNFNQK